MTLAEFKAKFNVQEKLNFYPSKSGNGRNTAGFLDGSTTRTLTTTKDFDSAKPAFVTPMTSRLGEGGEIEPCELYFILSNKEPKAAAFSL